MTELYNRFRQELLNTALLLAALVLLYASSFYNYLLFHSLAEIFSICIAFTIFIIAWNSQKYLNNTYLCFIGISYLFIGILDLFHTLSFKGMAIFTDYDYYANQLWIATRFIESISFLGAAYFLARGRILNTAATFAAYSLVTALVLLSIFTWKIFPVCFIDGIGLTQFKIFSEYVICFILLVDIFLLYCFRRHFDTIAYRLLFWSLIATIASELAFTAYVTNYDLSNLVGHYFKIISFYLMYKAIIEKGVKSPYEVIFRELKLSEAALAERNRVLEQQTRIDGLSGLLNHRAIYDQLDIEIDRANRYNSPFSIIMFDIDRFKSVNDTHGHQFGDEVITLVSRTITDTIRTMDTAGRYGGEEFLVLLPQIDLTGCRIVAERIRAAAEAMPLRNGVHITMSGGIASHAGESASAFVKRADDNLYRAKQEGRNRIVGSTA